jgi:lipopolysaccharide transport system ATP-binding protein
MSGLALKAEGLGKRYRTGVLAASYGRLSESLTSSARRLVRAGESRRVPNAYVWALRDVSLEVEQGEVVGVIGRNGAGKTTLLKILSGITEPSEGRVGINGRVGSLLEVGTGFHPELTGRENIFLNGAILGMRRREIMRKFDEIVEFAETGAYLDTPVKRYSSGMYVRLAFAVAAHLEPEILIVDEVLAVGDTAFQQKCLGKMGQVARDGLTVLFVSHNMALVSSICSTAYLLSGGRVSNFGPTDEVVQRYLGEVHDRPRTPLGERGDRTGNGDLRFTDLTIEGSAGALAVGDAATFTLGYEAVRPRSHVEVAIGIHGPQLQPLAHLHSKFGGKAFPTRPGYGTVECHVPELPLVPGVYSVDIFASAGPVILDWVRSAGTFQVLDTDYLGHGSLPEGGHGHLVVRQIWSQPTEAETGETSFASADAPSAA